MDGIKTGGRTKGTPNKITNEVKGRLESLIDGLVSSLDINDLNHNQRIKLLQIALQYTLPRLQAMVVKDETGDHPFIVEDIVIHTRKENSNEENWIDNFESHSALN
jgi:hypothetical protein